MKCNLGHDHPECEVCGSVDSLTRDAIQWNHASVCEVWLCQSCRKSVNMALTNPKALVQAGRSLGV